MGHLGGHGEQSRVLEADETIGGITPSASERGRPFPFPSKCRGAFLSAAHPSPAASYSELEISLTRREYGTVPEEQVHLPRADSVDRPKILAQTLTHHGGLFQELEAGFKGHLL